MSSEVLERDNSTAVLERDNSTADLDRIQLGIFVRRVVSEPDFRSLCERDAAEAIRISGITLTPAVEEVLIRNASRAGELTTDMDKVASSFFFFFLA